MIDGLDVVLGVLGNPGDNLQDRRATGAVLLSARLGAPPLAQQVVCGLGAREARFSGCSLDAVAELSVKPAGLLYLLLLRRLSGHHC
ncbi:MAG: hypothetical protein ABSG92_01840 [Conexivisphaerales archaeon]